MLKYLRIENIAVIETAEIDFLNGFNVLTGETGAGKSIIIDSINAVLGMRTSKDLIRKGCDKASVSAIFGNLGVETLKALRSNEIEPDDEGNVFISRSITQNSSSVKINGKTVTVGVLKEIGKYLIDIHGQHDSGLLLIPENHCSYIDRMAENSVQIDNYYAEFKKLNSIRRELKSVTENEDEKKRRKEYLEFCVGELKAADIKQGEREELKEKLTLAENYEKTAKSLNDAIVRISGNDEFDGALSLVEGAIKSISSINISKVDMTCKLLNGISAELEAAADSLRETVNSSDDISFNKDLISDRYDLVNRLIKKYGGSEEALFEFLENSEKELQKISMSGELEEKLSDELEKSTEKLIELGEILSQTRKKCADEFSRRVTETLKYLDMKNVAFDVNIQNGTYTKSGCDILEFVVKTNVGEDFLPLHKIASGGELSRIMLAIKSVLASADNVETMIFDEIDTGISGFAADKVGNRLKTISNLRQVICVTHLAQIAAYADNHLKIEKSVKNGRTYTNVTALRYEDRISEIARIMSGTEMTENLYNSAKELLDRSK